MQRYCIRRNSHFAWWYVFYIVPLKELFKLIEKHGSCVTVMLEPGHTPFFFAVAYTLECSHFSHVALGTVWVPVF